MIVGVLASVHVPLDFYRLDRERLVDAGWPVALVARVVLHRFATGRPLPAAFDDLDLASALS